MRQIELKRKMKTTVVPTDDGEVRQLLRHLGQPVTLYGERQVSGAGGGQVGSGGGGSGGSWTGRAAARVTTAGRP